MRYEVTRLIIRIVGNTEWLSDAYLDANVTPHRVNFGWFLQGFNSVESLVEFVAIDDGPSTSLYGMRGVLMIVFCTVGNTDEDLQTRQA